MERAALCKPLFSVFLLLAAAGGPRPAAAQSVAYEPFDNPAGQSLGGMSGGAGWSGAWTDEFVGPCTISAGSLASGSLAAFGNRASAPGPALGLYRNLAEALGPTNSTVYLSFLMRPIAGVAGSNAWGGISLLTEGMPMLFIGKGGANVQYALETQGGTGIRLSSTSAVEGQTALLVVRVVFAEGADTIDLWVNPHSGVTAPSIPDATKIDLDLGAPDSVLINSGDLLNFDLDEIRFGSTFASVTPQICYANCDGSTLPPVLNINDFTCFLNRFGSGDSYANCDGSVIAPVLNVADFICFLNKYAIGCP